MARRKGLVPTRHSRPSCLLISHIPLVICPSTNPRQAMPSRVKRKAGVRSSAKTTALSPPIKALTRATELKHKRITATGRSCTYWRMPIQEQKPFPQRITGARSNIGLTEMVPVVKPCRVGLGWQGTLDSKSLTLSAGSTIKSKPSRCGFHLAFPLRVLISA
jgi:hypothetical protein